MENRKLRIVSKVSSLLPILLAVMVGMIGILTVGFNEIKKKNVSQSLLQIETDRIANIDAQLSQLYKSVYINTDSLPLKNQLNQIQFLKEQRIDAVKQIDTTNKFEDSPTTIFSVALAIISVFLTTLFISSFKNSSIDWSLNDKKRKTATHQVQNNESIVVEKFEDFKERIKEESSRLNKQAVINLFLCFFIAFAFMGFVGYTTIYKSEINSTTTWTTFFMAYIPKLTGILGLLTMFLYFVRLYKANIIDAKYYQNELTNIEFKYIGLLSSTEIKNDETTIAIIKDFLVTDRNSILPKDQTTLELERIKIENEFNKSYLSQIWELKSIFEKKNENQ